MPSSESEKGDCGIRVPAEWERHAATWLSWPNRKGESFYGDLEPIFPALHAFISAIAPGEEVWINVNDDSAKLEIASGLSPEVMERVRIFEIPTNEPWCRDHAPTFVSDPKGGLRAVGWTFNGWGGRWGDFSIDAAAARTMAGAAEIPFEFSELICEGGAIDCNGSGLLLATESSLVDGKRNPGWSRDQIAAEFKRRLGCEEVLWLSGGELEGDDTAGHIDALARFVSEDRIVAGYQTGNQVTERVVRELESLRHGDGERFEVVALPMPPRLVVKGDVVPANYCNFYISNSAVIVPAFGFDEDKEAEKILAAVFPERDIVMIDSKELIYGLGSFHCLSHQVPLPDFVT